MPAQEPGQLFPTRLKAVKYGPLKHLLSLQNTAVFIIVCCSAQAVIVMKPTFKTEAETIVAVAVLMPRESRSRILVLVVNANRHAGALPPAALIPPGHQLSSMDNTATVLILGDLLDIVFQHAPAGNKFNICSIRQSNKSCIHT
ncbi:hypothetical protein B0H13DRAFT_1855114 [Mycena leptocephala]|nr:hypothetical protein B0H13DRAFT_1855114 [Mycena leptocephala]